MPLYSPDFGPCDFHKPLKSTIGLGPKGDNGVDGHSVTVEVVNTDPYGWYRLKFKDSVTNEVLAITPNLDPGSRTYLCTKNFSNVTEGTTYTAQINEFTTEQLGTIRDVRVGDLVIFKGEVKNGIRDFGMGVVNSISTHGVVTFKCHIAIGSGQIKAAVDGYIDEKIAQLTSDINATIAANKRQQDTYLANAKNEQDAYLANAKNQQDATIARNLETNDGRIKKKLDDLEERISNLTKNVYFALNDEGYFVAYIPESWTDIQFDTGTQYGEFDYGRLILRYNVDGSGVIDNTGRYDDPQEIIDRLERLEYTLYTRLGLGGE